MTCASSPETNIPPAAAAAVAKTEAPAGKLRIIFMGTPEFAVTSLKKLIEDHQQVVAVVTAPDKPAGRGRELRSSPVKDAAIAAGITVLQPANLKEEPFIGKLRSFEADLQVVVAFRMLPEAVWKAARIGTINLHASLLPQYRGAAPINWAIINGESRTGVTTFFINREIDTGEILLQQAVEIYPEDNARSLHDRLKETGAQLLVETVKIIAAGNFSSKPQSALTESNPLKTAPKLTKENCRIHWTSPSLAIVDFIRGLSPYPAAWTELSDGDRVIAVKIFRSEILHEWHSLPAGTLVTDNRSYLKAAAGDGFVVIKELQLAGKKRLDVTEFLKGFQDLDRYRFREGR